jgi:hypothetical protein
MLYFSGDPEADAQRRMKNNPNNHFCDANLVFSFHRLFLADELNSLPVC